MDNTTQSVPHRDQVDLQHCWNLEKLYPSDKAWEIDFQYFQTQSQAIDAYRGTIGESVETLLAYLEFHVQLHILEERLGYYAFLKVTEDGTNGDNQALQSRFTQTTSQISAHLSFVVPEIQAIDGDYLNTMLGTWKKINLPD